MWNPFNAWSEWSERRWRTSGVKKWERQRARGAWPFVLKFALAWGAWMVGVLCLVEYFWDGVIRAESLLVRVPVYFLGGLFVGWAVWAATEKKYLKHQGESREGGERPPARTNEGDKKLTADG